VSGSAGHSQYKFILAILPLIFFLVLNHQVKMGFLRLAILKSLFFFLLESCVVDNYTEGTVALVNYNINATELGCTLLEMVRMYCISRTCKSCLWWTGKGKE